MPARIPVCHFVCSVGTFCLEATQKTRSPSLQAMADCQRLLAWETENKIMLLWQHKWHHLQEAFLASVRDPHYSSRLHFSPKEP